MRPNRLAEVRSILASLAPPAPPCFDERGIWIEYLISAIDVQAARSGAARGPLLISPGGQIRYDRLDPDWSFCGDCEFSSAQRAHMRAIGTCRPKWWAQRVPALTEEEKAPKTSRAIQGGTRQRRVILIQPVADT
jgi:hypothetical protein